MKMHGIFACMSCVFCRIINRELPAKIFYETDEVIVIADHRPKDAVHLLIFPKKEYRNFQNTPPDVLVMLSETAKLVAIKLGVTEHYRIHIHNGYGQEVDHIHFHFLSDRGADRLTYLPR
ncbi:histidine triad nucleotide-binding protein [candidate division GN15 bacterium]|uniref:Histidine triad nucleotide-binding protein n=1 Tax=candidate division GN15 bacterium TaxID=2072418 RepID=A0A855X453_9BACT|nr:MAG: histidine triad nucleotide-binding protein [candidate division GN15 bacterium]